MGAHWGCEFLGGGSLRSVSQLLGPGSFQCSHMVLAAVSSLSRWPGPFHTSPGASEADETKHLPSVAHSLESPVGGGVCVCVQELAVTL